MTWKRSGLIHLKEFVNKTKAKASFIIMIIQGGVCFFKGKNIYIYRTVICKKLVFVCVKSLGHGKNRDIN